MTFFEHLEELRWHFIRSIVAIVVFAVISFIRNDIIFDKILLAPKNADFITFRWFCQLAEKLNMPEICIKDFKFSLINIEMSGQFMTHIWSSIVAGLIIAFPYIMWEFWRFIKPALTEKEIKYSKGFVLVTSFLFFSGVMFGYYIITPVSVNFLGTYRVSEQVLNQINLDSYISTVTVVTLSSGIVFELPVLAYFLTKIRIITPEFMRKYRRHAIVLIFILAAIITPTTDMVTQTAVALPLILLYEVSIWVSKFVTIKFKTES